MIGYHVKSIEALSARETENFCFCLKTRIFVDLCDNVRHASEAWTMTADQSARFFRTEMGVALRMCRMSWRKMR